MGFSDDIMKLRYSWDKADGTKETWEDIAKRVSKFILSPIDFTDRELYQEKIEKMIAERKFIPGGRFLAQAGRDYHQVNNCFLLRAEDTRESWGDLANKATVMLMSGGGLGIDYSNLRPKNSPLKRSGGVSSGSIPLMKMINEIGRGVMAGGKRRCLPVGTLIETSRGLIPIEQINIGDLAKTRNGYYPITGKLNQGNQKTIIIKTQNGDLECTPNHRVAVFDTINTYTFKMAKDLTKEDRLVFSQEKSVFENEYDMPQYTPLTFSDHAHTTTSIKIPKLDRDIAWLIGLFHGDGYVGIFNHGVGKRNGRVSISCSHNYMKLMEKAIAQLKRFGVNASIKKYENYSNVVVSSVQLAEYFLQFKTANSTMTIPDFIMNNSDSKIRASYLAGLFDADGSENTRPLNMVSSVYPEYLKQVQNLISTLGIASRLKLRRKAKNNFQNLFVVNIATKKQFRMVEKEIMKYSLKYIGKREIKNAQFSYTFSKNILKNSFEKYPKELKNRLADYSSDFIEKIIKKKFNILPISIVSIEDGRNIETWDIEVDGVEEFITNGYIVHNSAIWAGLRWSHGDIFDFIEAKNWTEEVKKIKEKDFDFPAPLDMTNISVILDKDFFNAYDDKENILHKHAKDVYWKVVESMVRNGEPGFSVDYDNKNESLRNACTEIVSEDDCDVCCLGSINLPKIKDIEELKEVTNLAILFLLSGTEYSDVPHPKVKEVKRRNRRLGLGLMGIHEWLIRNGQKYEPNLLFGEWLQNWKDESERASEKWSRELGVSKPIKLRALAPNGTISIAGGQTTSGIEPIFSLAYKRRYLTPEGWKQQYVVDFVAERLHEEGYDMNKVEDSYSLAMNVEKRISFQAFVQGYVDNAISSTINTPPFGSIGNNDPKKFGEILYKYLPKLRGITVYPDGSRGGQPLTSVDFNEAINKKNVVFEGNEECVDGVCGL